MNKNDMGRMNYRNVAQLSLEKGRGLEAPDITNLMSSAGLDKSVVACIPEDHDMGGKVTYLSSPLQIAVYLCRWNPVMVGISIEAVAFRQVGQCTIAWIELLV